MIAALLGPRIAGWVTGIAAQAIAVAVACALIVGGLWWLRHDARMDERNAWKKAMSDAKAAGEAAARKRETAAAKVALDELQKRTTELADSETARREAEARLAQRQRVIAYPKDIIPSLNK